MTDEPDIRLAAIEIILNARAECLRYADPCAQVDTRCLDALEAAIRGDSTAMHEHTMAMLGTTIGEAADKPSLAHDVLLALFRLRDQPFNGQSWRPDLLLAPHGGTNGLGTQLVPLQECSVCHQPMMYAGVSRHLGHVRASWPEAHDWDNSTHVCKPCLAAGKFHMTCALCHEERTSDQVQQSFGDPAEHLCKMCYRTVIASEWAAEVARLEDAHRWDFE